MISWHLIANPMRRLITPRNGLPEYPYVPYDPEVAVPLWQEDNCLPSALHQEDSIPEVRLDQVNGPVPVPTSGYLSLIDTVIHTCRCSSRIPYGSTNRCCHR